MSVAAMGSQITLSALQSRWAVVGSTGKWYSRRAIVGYDYFLTLDHEIQYIWKRKITSASVIYIVIRYSSLIANVLTLFNFFPWPRKSTTMYAPGRASAVIIMSSAVFSSLRAHALCQRKLISYLVLALGAGNAVPSVYGAIKNKVIYNPGINGVDGVCDVDFSHFISFRKWGSVITSSIGVLYFVALLAVNVTNLAFINNIQVTLHLMRVMPPKLMFSFQLSLDFIGALSATAAVLTCRFILDLFEASTRTRFGTGPTIRLSAMPSMVPSRSLASRHFGGLSAAGNSQAIFDGGVSRRKTEDSESVYCTTDDYDFELHSVNPQQRKSGVHPSDS
ncbi:uncharacterized protein BXZ73DRAFT_98087 [Epithele typhae]|uniref:uncharacterized protein n=1 Tax=Epithele typhae TaxID=378194 RepID=UPI002007D87E|nr:uncharacterized protein BXZ73DRAFT_98087 [Epithele typhae]KAH9941696.1 hypothetical protein BXZ73DRAFT_98087 [Epithele typhae]